MTFWRFPRLVVMEVRRAEREKVGEEQVREARLLGWSRRSEPGGFCHLFQSTLLTTLSLLGVKLTYEDGEKGLRATNMRGPGWKDKVGQWVMQCSAAEVQVYI